MASPYEVEHNIKPSSAPRRARQVDMSTFDSHLNNISGAGPTSPNPTTADSQHAHNPHATPTPVDMAALFRLLQDQFLTLMQDSPSDDNRELLETLAATIENDIHNPPTKVAGVSQEYLDTLDRVPRKSLKKEDSCPICVERYLDDQYPLVVQLPCHGSHQFDLECVGPWLKSKGSCPLCRTDLNKKKAPIVVDDDDEEEEDDGGMFA